VVIVRTRFEAYYPTLDTVTQRGMYPLLVIFVTKSNKLVKSV
jgi:hypothetical protein